MAKARIPKLGEVEDPSGGQDLSFSVRSKFNSGDSKFDQQIDEALYGCRSKEDMVDNFLADLFG